MVSVITVNYNQSALTCSLLESIRLQDYLALEVIVVDNGSDENPSRLFLSRFPDIKFVRSERNLGFAGGNNLALSVATGDYLFFVNNDAELTDGCILRLVDFLEKHPQAGIVSPLICYGRQENDNLPVFHDLAVTSSVQKQADVIQYAGMRRVSRFTGQSATAGNGEPNRGQFQAPFQTAYAHGAAMMVPARVIREVGSMDESYFLYYEEVDWCERMHKAGFEVWVEPRALVYHKESMTMKQLGAIKTYYLTRNRILFMRRHFPGWSLWVFAAFFALFSIPKNLAAYALERNWRDMKAFLKGIAWHFKAARPQT